MPKRELPRSQEFPEQGEATNGVELDPIVEGLLSRLPHPGDTWPQRERKLWMQILDLVFQLIYEEEEPESTQPGQPAPEQGR